MYCSSPSDQSSVNRGLPHYGRWLYWPGESAIIWLYSPRGQRKASASTGYWLKRMPMWFLWKVLARPDLVITSAFRVLWVLSYDARSQVAPRARRGLADNRECHGLASEKENSDSKTMKACARGSWPGKSSLCPLLSWCRGCPSFDTYRSADTLCLDAPDVLVAR